MGVSAVNKLRPYQEIGAFWLANMQSALLGDDMGLGKTPQAAVALRDVVAPTDRVLVICPAALRVNWQRELKVWFKELTTGIADSDEFPKTACVIISYNGLKRWFLKLRSIKWRIIVCDEAHYMKTLDSQRTINVRGGFGKPPIPTEMKWALTGTPLPNRPIEIYPVLKWLDCEFARKEVLFGTRYCGGAERDFRGATNLPELREKLGKIMLRRLKADVLTELPPKTRQVIDLELGEDGRAAKAEERTALRDAGLTFEQVIQQLNAGTIPSNKGLIAKLRRLVGLAKVSASAEHIIETLDSVDKIIVFAHHRDVIDSLNTRVKEVVNADGQYTVSLTGETPKGQRQRAIDNFQEDPNCRVFFGNITAAGVGITLTAASLVVFVERSWVPGENTQAEDRAHRYGQTRGVLIQHLVLNDSLDSYMARAVIAKQAVLDAILN